MVAENISASRKLAYFERTATGCVRKLLETLLRAGSATREAWLIGLTAALVCIWIDQSGIGTTFFHFVAAHPEYELDDILLGALALGVGALLFSLRRWRDLKCEIAARKRTEERLDHARGIARIGSWEYDVAANRYIWSREMYRLRGLSPDTFVPTSSAVAAFVHPDDEPQLRRFRDDLRAGVARGPIDVRITQPSGRIRLLRYEGQAIVDHDGSIRHVVGTAQDITEEELARRQLIHAQKMQEIGNLAGGIAHDFNNVLGIVVANLELLQDYTAGSTAAEELRADALAGALHGAELTHQLLAYARRQPLQAKVLDLNELIGSMSRLLARLLGENITLDLHLASDLWKVLIDPTQMEASLTNLIANARDAMTQGGEVTISTRNVHISGGDESDSPGLAPGAYVVLLVSDTGAGISPGVMDKIFDPFFTTKYQGKGSGLGLAMVRGFVEQSGGHIAAQSQSGQGTTFSIYLPRTTKHAPRLPRTRVSNRSSIEPGSLETILVVEDNPRLRYVTVKQLVHLGYRVFEASDAEAAKNVLSINRAVDMLFTDIVLPGGLDGIGLAEWAVACSPRLLCLLTCGYSEIHGREQRFMALGCRLLKKPFRQRDLARVVRETFDRSHSSQVAANTIERMPGSDARPV